MKPKTLVLMGVAIVCGLGASYMTSRLIAERNETVKVLLPKAKYGQWTLIKDPAVMFEERDMLKNEAPKNAVAKMDELKDRILIRNLAEGQPVVYEDLQDKTKGSLETQLTPGMRAVAIKVDAPTSAGGFVLPGSHVDIYHALRHGDSSESKLILQNILVRAVDQLPVRPEDRPGIVPTTVTLEVSPDQALMLTRVKDTGSLTLALRPPGDTGDVQDTVTVKPPPPPPPKMDVVQKPDPADRQYLTIFNGSHWTRATYVTRNGEVTTQIEKSGVDPQGPTQVTTPAPQAPKQATPPAERK